MYKKNDSEFRKAHIDGFILEKLQKTQNLERYNAHM